MEEALSFLTVFFFLSDGGINTVDYYYYLLLYCSSAGMGLTRDSALSGLPASNNLVLANVK